MGQEEETLNNKEGKVAVKHPRKKYPAVSTLNDDKFGKQGYGKESREMREETLNVTRG